MVHQFRLLLLFIHARLERKLIPEILHQLHANRGARPVLCGVPPRTVRVMAWLALEVLLLLLRGILLLRHLGFLLLLLPADLFLLLYYFMLLLRVILVLLPLGFRQQLLANLHLTCIYVAGLRLLCHG